MIYSIIDVLAFGTFEGYTVIAKGLLEDGRIKRKQILRQPHSMKTKYVYIFQPNHSKSTLRWKNWVSILFLPQLEILPTASPASSSLIVGDLTTKHDPSKKLSIIIEKKYGIRDNMWDCLCRKISSQSYCSRLDDRADARRLFWLSKQEYRSFRS